MNEILAVTLQGMRADMAKLDGVAMNLANALTPGYKRQVVSAFSALVEGSAVTVHADSRQGTMKGTGQALDLALSGPGWFEVMAERGPAYTRHGSFQSDARGRLVTPQGHALMGTAGEIQLPPGAVLIDAQGRMFEAEAGSGGLARTRGEPIAQLKLVRFDDGAPMERLGDGLVAFAGVASQPADARTEVRQGYLENSNVSSVQEMMQLLQTMRHFESLQKVALGYDEMLAGAIRKLGEAN